jgi:CMP/dCMP kinase
LCSKGYSHFLFRIVTISGLSFTGTTTLASELAQNLGWNFLSAGKRFRQYCNGSGLPLTAIPNDVHLAFDATIQEEIRALKHVVMEGRYLGFFARDYRDVLTVWVYSNMPSRSARCLEREDSISSLQEAESHIMHRDNCEKGVGNDLYGLADFTDPSQFARVFENNVEDDRKIIISALLSIVLAGSQAIG